MIKRIDFGLLATLVLCLFAFWPLAAQPGLPNGTDVLYHVFRAAAMDRSWAHGVLLPHWAEGLYYGYGSPLFHYYASSTYYLTSILTRLFAFDALNSLRAVIVLSVLAGGAGMYLFVKQRAGVLAGIITAQVYVYSPYLLFTEPYARGDYPEMLAFALFPVIIWRFERLLDNRRARDLVLAALGVGLLIITHNLMALVISGLIVVWLIWGLAAEFVGRRLPGSSRGQPVRPYSAYGLAFAGVGLGIGLAAYFWLPVLLETGAVQLENLTGIELLDYRNFFISPGELLAFTPRADAGSINGLLHLLHLGVAQWGLAVVGLAGFGVFIVRQQDRWASLRDPLTRQVVFFALAAAGLIFLMLPVSAFVWDAVRPLAYLQFPWRFLGPAAFCLAVLAGLNARWFARLPARWMTITTAGAVVLPVALALPSLFVPTWVHKNLDTSIAGYHELEVPGFQRGTTFTNEYLPRDVYVLANPTDWLLADYADGYPVDHANRANIPPDTTIDLLDNGPQHSAWQVDVSAPFTMEVLIHYFAGWQAEIDGRAVDITPSDPHGFINFPVPAGAHTVRVFLGSTPPRDLGVLVTVVAGVLLLVAARLIQIRGQAADSERPGGQPVIGPQWRTGFLLGFGLNLLLVVVFMREGLAWVNSPPGEAMLAQHRTHYTLSDGGETSVQLVGYDLSGDRLKPGDTIQLVVYWYAPGPIAHRYQTFVHVSTGGPPHAQADKQNPAGFPTTEWTSSGYVRDAYEIALPENIPPGEYNLLIGWYTCETMPPGACGNGDRLRLEDEPPDGMPDDAIFLQTIMVQ